MRCFNLIKLSSSCALQNAGTVLCIPSKTKFWWLVESTTKLVPPTEPFSRGVDIGEIIKNMMADLM